MSVQAVQPTGTAKPFGVWTPVIVTPPGRLVFVSGYTSRNEAGEVVGVGDIRAQTRQVCENLRRAMNSVGGDLSHIVSVTVFVRDITQFDDIHAVRREFFPSNPPTSTMVEISRLVDERSLIEINAIAVLP